MTETPAADLDSLRKLRDLALAASRERPDGQPRERALYARVAALSPEARELARLAFVQRKPFVEVVARLGLDGPAMTAAVTSLRRLVALDATSPPAAETPPYVRLPFLVSGHLAPDDALRVREHLGSSEICRRAYRELDELARAFAEAGPGVADPHPATEALVQAARGELSPDGADAIEEHVRYCAGCAEALASLRASSPAPTGARTSGAARRTRAIVLLALSLVVPIAAHAWTGSNVLRAAERGGLDLGPNLADAPGREPAVLAPGAGGRDVAVEADVPYEPGVVFDVRLEAAAGGRVAELGGLRFEADGPRARVPLAIEVSRLAAGDYRVVVLRRFLGVGGVPAEYAFPVRVPR
ncbi:MAG TPA: zf-HC2 domain-containing protein [Planctomycetota bacterium]|nr:zf-HC2 domain-containing protein [Planctomycetota bacterium]